MSNGGPQSGSSYKSTGDMWWFLFIPKEESSIQCIQIQCIYQTRCVYQIKKTVKILKKLIKRGQMEIEKTKCNSTNIAGGGGVVAFPVFLGPSTARWLAAA